MWEIFGILGKGKKKWDDYSLQFLMKICGGTLRGWRKEVFATRRVDTNW
jgi:hypothetical protein